MLPKKPEGWIERGASGPAVVRPQAYPPQRHEMLSHVTLGQSTRHLPETKPMSKRLARQLLAGFRPESR